MCTITDSDFSNPFGLLGKDFTCPACGQRHRVWTEQVLISDDCLQRLPNLMKNRPVAVVADARTATVAGNDVVKELESAGYKANLYCVPDCNGRNPQCDDVTKCHLQQWLPVHSQLIAVGSGVINDLVKWVASERSVRYSVVATAPSMNGYTSDNIAATVNGVKVLERGRAPQFVLARPRDLAAAPCRMITAGFGDLLAKSVSSLDWRLNALLFDDFFCCLCIDIVERAEEQCLKNAENLKARDPDAVTQLFEALLLAGLSMSIAGTSAPASGGEHLISHTLDMKGAAENRGHDLHGRQVGVGTICAAAFYQAVMEKETPPFDGELPPFDPLYWGKFADMVREHAGRKEKRFAQAAARFRREPNLWASVRSELRPRLRSAAMLKDALQRAGGAHRIQDLKIERDYFYEALLHSHEMRERFTVLELSWLLGILPGQGLRVIQQYLTNTLEG